MNLGKHNIIQHCLFAVFVMLFGAGIGVAATVDFQLVKQSTQTTTTEWVQHGHDAQHTGYQPQAVAHPWRWKWSWNGPNASGGLASGHHTLPRNVQPITGGTYVFIADGSNGVRVLNKSDGAVARTLSPGGNCNGTPAYDISSGMLFIPSSNGNLYKVNPANGSTAGMYNAGSAIVGGVCLALHQELGREREVVPGEAHAGHVFLRVH
jgi:outer membrane protein assembly factor BamB